MLGFNIIVLLLGVLAQIGAYKLGGWWGLMIYWGVCGNMAWQTAKIKNLI